MTLSGPVERDCAADHHLELARTPSVDITYAIAKFAPSSSKTAASIAAIAADAVDPIAYAGRRRARSWSGDVYHLDDPLGGTVLKRANRAACASAARDLGNVAGDVDFTLASSSEQPLAR